jgi:putative glutamine amidotransferase
LLIVVRRCYDILFMHAENNYRPRVGVPWRTAAEEKTGDRKAYKYYLDAVRDAGGEPVEVSLLQSDEELRRQAESLDAVLLTGSPADVDPSRYGAARNALTNVADPKREHVDDTLIDHSLATGKPLLGICYGVQSLNVHFGGSLMQDVPTELGTQVNHDHEEDEPDARHPAQIEGGYLAEMAGRGEVNVNSSHHQAILNPGRGLRVTAHAPDGVIEAMEFAGGPAWILGVQWHPERMHGDALADALFKRLIQEAARRHK